MRIRTVKPEFFTHEGLYEAERATKLPIRVAFAGLWCAADKRGRFKWEARRLGVAILPYDGHDFSRVLDALLTRAFIVKYASLGVDYGWIPSFERHQFVNNREKDSDLPAPTQAHEDQHIDASGTRESRDDDALEGERKDKGKEGEGEGDGRVDDASVFSEAWNSLPEPFPKVRDMTDGRKSSLKQRMRDQFWASNWKAALDMLPSLEFCKGANEKKWVANVDFFLRPDSVAKIVEGKYGNRSNGSQPEGPPRAYMAPSRI